MPLSCLQLKGADEPPCQLVHEEVTSIMSAFTKAKLVKPLQYIDSAFVPPTSNKSERILLSVMLILTNLRKSANVSSLKR